MKVSDYIANVLAEHAITHVFGFAGGAITHLIDSIYSMPSIEFVSMHHEQGAAFAAEGYARVSGKVGVSMATSGPGATNLITGIGSSYFDSIPCLYITGQVNTYEYKFERPLRQLGFQEMDIVSMVKPITKDAVLLTDSSETRYTLERLLYLTTEGRPGPVLLDIPMNIQRADINPEAQRGFSIPQDTQARDRVSQGQMADIQKAITLLKEAKRPVILAGGGIRLSGAQIAFKEFVEKSGIPVVSTLMGLDSFPQDNEYAFGLIGAYGNRYGNYALANSDLILVLGSRLTGRQTGTNVKNFARAANIIHVDIDPHELRNRLQETLSICMDVDQFLNIAYKNICWKSDAFDDWMEWLRKIKLKYPRVSPETCNRVDPYTVMDRVSKIASATEIFTVDVGQNQMWTAQGLRPKKGQRLLFSGGMGSMGFALPVAIGAYYADPSREITAIVGDGGLQMNIQEMNTVVRNKIPLKIILLNNKSLGMIRQFQQLYFGGRCVATVEGYDCPDFKKLAEAYAWKYVLVDNLESLEVMSAGKMPTFFEIPIEMTCNVIPKLEIQRPIEDQSPLIDRSEFKGNMIIELDDSSL